MASINTNKNKREVYVLSGASDAGKTTTLNHLAWLVSNLPGSVQKEGPMPKAFGATGNGTDSQYYFEIPVGDKILKVGISTKGDGSQEIQDGFKFFDKWDCNICFIASKTFGRTTVKGRPFVNSVMAVEGEAKQRGLVPKYCYLINEHHHRAQTAIEQAAAQFLCSFVK